MNILTDTPPVTVQIGGASVPVNANFRVILQIDELREQGLSEMERGIQTMQLFYGKIPEDVESATERLLWFMRCGEPEKKGKGGKAAKPDFSFSFDAPLIYAAFRDQYGLDLISIDFLHWWTFRALLDNLRPEHRFCEVRRCRSIDLGKVKDREMKRYYTEMKKLYALPLPEDAQAEIDAITEALMNGGDVSKVLASKGGTP